MHDGEARLRGGVGVRRPPQRDLLLPLPLRAQGDALRGRFASIHDLELESDHAQEVHNFFPAVVISDPKFVGPHSVMKVALSSALRFASHFSLEVRPESADGTLLYLGQTRDAKHLDFFSLALRYRPTMALLGIGIM